LILGERAAPDKSADFQAVEARPVHGVAVGAP